MLSAEHLKMLREESGISEAVIAARGYRTITDVKELKTLEFMGRQLRVPGLLLPLHTTDGTQPLSVYRPDNPYREKNDKVHKYLLPPKTGLRLDCPPMCRPMLEDPSIPLWITEGQKKADALATAGAGALALLGVDGFVGKNAFKAITFLADWQYVGLPGRQIYLVFDNDLMEKQPVRRALALLTEHVQRKGAHVAVVYLPHDKKRKWGVDEFLVAGHTLGDLKELAKGPRPEVKPAAPVVELLDEAPLTMRRPLARLAGSTHVAVWPYVKVTVREKTTKGEVVRLQQPEVRREQRLMVVRDDGQVFGERADAPLETLGIEIALDTMPPQNRLWTTRALKAYRAGTRPDPATVFQRVASVFDHYLDFDRSLASQAEMSQLSACLSLMTWYTEVFDVVPYPWANGDWGSGKTKWGTIWAMTSYLGLVLTLGGSFAALRDMADFGAALLFDDTENLNDPKIDPDKKALLLAGNRRGATVPFKEPAGDRGWKIRWANAFCPRGFTSKGRLSEALETRALRIPLVRTGNPRKANRDPAREAGWPCSCQQLQDDLWAIALTLMPEASKVWAELDEETDAVGRGFEVWRAPLAVACLFEKHGVKGLEATIRQIMKIAGEEKSEDPNNHTVQVVRAIGAFVFNVSDVSDLSDLSDVYRGEFTATQIAEKVHELAEEDDEDVAWATYRAVGWVFSDLRLPRKRDTSTKKSTKLRVVTQELVLNLLRSHGLLPPITTSDTSETSETSDKKAANDNAGDAGNAGNAGAEANGAAPDPEAERMAAEERAGMQDEDESGGEDEPADDYGAWGDK